MLLREWYCYANNESSSALGGGKRKTSRVLLPLFDEHKQCYIKVKVNLCICMNALYNALYVG